MENKAVFNYFYGFEADMYSFYRIPKIMFLNEYFKNLSCEAKVLYGLMLDRMSLSIKNRWLDEDNRVYIIFTIEDVMEMMNCSRTKAVKCIAELDTEKGIGLIEKKRLGLGKANIIYVKNFVINERIDNVPSSDKFDYFYGSEADTYSFYRIPKVMFLSDYFKNLSCEAKVLYGLMLDRMSLSIKNRWFDEDNRVYIIFTVEDVMEMMCCSRTKAVKCMAELDAGKGIGLTEKKRLGLGKANIIYVKNFIIKENNNYIPSDEKNEEHEGYKNQDENTIKTSINTQKYKKQTSRSLQIKLQEVQNTDFIKSTNETSKSSENKLQEVQNVDCNYTDLNYTEGNDINQSINHEEDDGLIENPADRLTKEEQRSIYSKVIQRNLNYISLLEMAEPGERDFYEQTYELILDFVSTRQRVKINQTDYEYEVVKSRFLKLTYEDLKYVYDCMENNKKKITNMKSYLMTALYNATLTNTSYWQSRARSDFRKS